MARSISVASRPLIGLTSTPTDGATDWMTANWPIPAAMVESRSTAARVDPHVAAIRPAELLQPLQERRVAGLCVHTICARAHQHADVPRATGLLGPQRARPRDRRPAECQDKRAPLHSITSSAVDNTR